MVRRKRRVRREGGGGREGRRGRPPGFSRVATEPSTSMQRTEYSGEGCCLPSLAGSLRYGTGIHRRHPVGVGMQQWNGLAVLGRREGGRMGREGGGEGAMEGGGSEGSE